MLVETYAFWDTFCLNSSKKIHNGFLFHHRVSEISDTSLEDFDRKLYNLGIVGKKLKTLHLHKLELEFKIIV